jgi:hypothetical protein
MRKSTRFVESETETLYGRAFLYNGFPWRALGGQSSADSMARLSCWKMALSGWLMSPAQAITFRPFRPQDLVIDWIPGTVPRANEFCAFGAGIRAGRRHLEKGS